MEQHAARAGRILSALPSCFRRPTYLHTISTKSQRSASSPMKKRLALPKAIRNSATADGSLRGHVHPMAQTVQIPMLLFEAFGFQGPAWSRLNNAQPSARRHCRRSILCTSIADGGIASWVRLITAIHWCDRHLGVAILRSKVMPDAAGMTKCDFPVCGKRANQRTTTTRYSLVRGEAAVAALSR